MRQLFTPSRARAGIALGVAAAVVAGGILRFLATSPLWLDEALSVNIASLPFGDIADALRHDGHPPAYYWLLHGWMQLFGDSDLAVRSLSGVCSVLALPLMWWLGRRTGGPPVGRGALVLLAVSPFAVRYGTEARMYALVMLLVLAGALVIDNVLERPRPSNVLGLALVSGGLLWTHYWSAYLLATVGALLLVWWWRDRSCRPIVRWAIGGLLGGGLLFLPWLPTLVDQAAHTGTPWADPSRPTVVVQVTVADLGGGGFAEALLLGTLLVVLVVSAYAHLGRADLREPAEPLDVRVLTVVAGGTLALGSVVSFLSGSAYASRYGAVVAPLVLVVAAVGLTRLRPIWMQRGIAAAVVVLAGAAIVHNVGDERTGAGALAEQIEARVGRNDLVVVCPDQLSPALERALGRRQADVPILPYPSGRDPQRVDWRDYEERNDAADPEEFAAEVLDAAAGAPIWVVWNTSYRTFEGHCEALIDAIGAVRPAELFEPGVGAFESADLVRFG